MKDVVAGSKIILGHYLDIAANDPVTTSNSFFFDRCLGWGGICCRSKSTIFWTYLYSAFLSPVPTCLTTEDGSKIKFAFKAGFGGIRDDTYENEAKYKNETLPEVQMRCTTCAPWLIIWVWTLKDMNYQCYNGLIGTKQLSM